MEPVTILHLCHLMVSLVLLWRCHRLSGRIQTVRAMVKAERAARIENEISLSHVRWVLRRAGE